MRTHPFYCLKILIDPTFGTLTGPHTAIKKVARKPQFVVQIDSRTPEVPMLWVERVVLDFPVLQGVYPKLLGAINVSNGYVWSTPNNWYHTTPLIPRLKQASARLAQSTGWLHGRIICQLDSVSSIHIPPPGEKQSSATWPTRRLARWDVIIDLPRPRDL